jgi:hypothetical protein
VAPAAPAHSKERDVSLLSTLFRRGAIGVAAAAVLAVAAPASAQQNVLRVVPHSNLAVLDPIWTTAYMSRNHGYMIYDTLFGTDEKGQIKPQMVDTWSVSADNRLYTFKLRKGLVFHDGAPVTGDDVIASIKRWGARDAMGSALMQFVSRMDSPQPDTFRIFLGEACGFVLEALGKPGSSVPFIMPKRVADTDPFKQIDDYVGSGPYVFKRDEFKPGDKAVYLKFDKYVPRDEPPSGTTGGKRVFVDRVEWNLALRDGQAQVAALQKGEVDIIEQLPFDFYETVKKDPNLQLTNYANIGLHRHHRDPAFDAAGQRERPDGVLALGARHESRRVERHAVGLEDRRAHVDGHAAVALDAGHDHARLRPDADLVLVGQPLVAHEAHEAARAVAALLDLAAVGVEDPVDEVHVGAVGRLDQQHLVGAHAEVAIRERAPLRLGQRHALAHAVEHDEVVARALHLGEPQPHPAIIAQSP